MCARARPEPVDFALQAVKRQSSLIFSNLDLIQAQFVYNNAEQTPSSPRQAVGVTS